MELREVENDNSEKAPNSAFAVFPGSSRDQPCQFPELRIAPLRQAPAKAPFEFHHCYVSLEDFEAEKSAAEREFPSSGSIADM